MAIPSQALFTLRFCKLFIVFLSTNFMYFQFEDEEDDSTAAQPPKRHKAEPKPLKTIQENVDEQAMETGGESPVNVRLGKTLGFDESIHEATNFIDPKSLFVCMF